MRRRSVILLSGGLDSAANLAFCREYDDPAFALTARYGQRAAEPELRAARELCRYYDVPLRILDLPWLGALGGSALTEPSLELPEPAPGALDQPELARGTARVVWVPNRNGILIQAAAAFAEASGASRVVVGFNREEAATFPDNSTEFLERSTRALGLSTANQVEVFSYTAEWDKREIVRELCKLGRAFPFGLLWSCYSGGERPCGRCESCLRLERALAVRRDAVGRVEPVPVEDHARC